MSQFIETPQIEELPDGSLIFRGATEPQNFFAGGSGDDIITGGIVMTLCMVALAMTLLMVVVVMT
ncbi:hypothetical protein APLC1_3407 [Limnospira platensis C1]|nr:hypothetical protein APLC1_3407 [Arthrospira platensis C1]